MYSEIRFHDSIHSDTKGGLLSMHSSPKIAIVLFAMLFMAESSMDVKTDTIPPFYTDLINSVPDYYQRDRAFGGFPLGGSMYCGPTAASNALEQLEKTDSKLNVLDSTVTGKRQQYELIKKLGTQSYCNTGKDGSGPAQICRGLKKILNESTSDEVSIHHYGWRNAGKNFQVVTGVPPLDEARISLYNKNAVLINFGWYEYNKKNNTYTRKGGHWVTLAGYGHNGKEADSSVIIVHDPETPWTVNDYIRLRKIDGGTLKGSVPELPVDASGFYAFPNGFRRFGIIDGFIVISVKSTGENHSIS
jgi:hypothetical protein